LAYRIVYKKSVFRDLGKMTKKEARRVLSRLEKDLTEKGDSYPPLKGKFAGLREYRVGEYRVIYAIIEADVVVLRIAHRRDIYK